MPFKILSVLFATYLTASSIQINYVKVPIAVKNDSKTPIILDCNYSLRPDDTDLVVKWYLNDDLVYQWIPPHKPQDFGLLKGKVDLQYRATDDPKSVHRAMKIKNPTSEIAGEYRCYVSTFTDEDSSIKNMIVFVPERSLYVFKSGFDDVTMNFTCLVSEVYPAPKLIIYKDNAEDVYSKNRLMLLHRDLTKHPNGKYTMTTVASTPIDTLSLGTIIRCELRIPGTGYVKIKSLLYSPEDDTENSCQRIKSNFVLLLLLPFLFIFY